MNLLPEQVLLSEAYI